MTAGAASILARRAERAAAMQRRLEEGRAAADRSAAERAATVSSTRATAALPRTANGGLVPGATQQAKSLLDKKKWRRSSLINSLLPKGTAALTTFPRREEARFGK